jgi:capsular exopolysaccharide synthesis family protein
MSRIHEALKKAEQERMENPSTTVAPPIEEIPITPVMAERVATAAAAVARAVTVAPETFGGESQWTHANLLVQCAKPEWKPDQDSILFLDNDSHHEVGMEEFRTLRSRLYRIREHRPLKTILVGSALPAEGKSFVSANLAQILSRQHGRRALLIDGDLRAPRLHKYFGAPLSPGLSDYLRGDANEFQVIQQSPSENLFFIPGGTTVGTPSELVSNGRIKTLIDRVSGIFDWIVIDSSPILPVSDAGLLSQYCDGVLMVVLAAKTPSEMAQRACKEFKDRPLLGVVLNRVRAAGHYSSYYYYGRYGYGYGYGAPAKSSGRNGKH